jgi:hypothetical protein
VLVGLQQSQDRGRLGVAHSTHGVVGLRGGVDSAGVIALARNGLVTSGRCLAHEPWALTCTSVQSFGPGVSVPGGASLRPRRRCAASRTPVSGSWAHGWEHEDHLGAAGTEQPRPEQRPGRVADSQMGAVPGGPGVVDDPSRGVRHRGLGGGIPGVRLAAQRDSRDPRPAGRASASASAARRSPCGSRSSRRRRRAWRRGAPRAEPVPPRLGATSGPGRPLCRPVRRWLGRP